MPEPLGFDVATAVIHAAILETEHRHHAIAIDGCVAFQGRVGAIGADPEIGSSQLLGQMAVDLAITYVGLESKRSDGSVKAHGLMKWFRHMPSLQVRIF